MREPVAVVGLGCRFPGGAESPAAYWRLLADGVDAIREVPRERWDVDAYYDPDPEAPGKIYTRSGGFLERIDQFDPAFFGISPREAAGMDPQQRLLLEVAWEALEDAGLVPERLAGSATGVWVGQFMDEYSRFSLHTGEPERIDAYGSLGTLRSMSAGRLAYVLGLHGPVLALDTACSSSLLAVHLACQSLDRGECDLALAGGVNLTLFPEALIGLCRLKAVAADGRSKTFDAAADGYGRGEGCGMVVLERLADARAHGHPVLAVVRGSAVNHDGRSNGLTAPNGVAQEALLRRALTAAEVAPAELAFVEAHGTGTSLGDPIEVLALSRVLCAGRTPAEPLLIASGKTNIGHLETAAGVAALIKVVLSLHHREVPPHLHLENPNPRVPWDRLPLRVPRERTPLAPQGRLLAGVSSFGMSGTNVHAVLESAPEEQAPELPSSQRPEAERSHHLLVLSARTAEALVEQARRHGARLEEGPDLPLADLCAAAARGRTHFPHRAAFNASSAAELAGQLARFAAAGPREPDPQGPAPHAPAGPPRPTGRRRRPRLAFLFTGQAAHHPGMGRELFDAEPPFRRLLERADEILCRHGVPLLELLYGGGDDTLLERTVYAQPVLFALQCALAELWRAWGVEPDAVAGHSVGELAAAWVAGVFGLEDGLRLVAERGRLMEEATAAGAMAVITASEERVAAALAAAGGQVVIAGLNGPDNTVISGPAAAVEALCAALRQEGVEARPLAVTRAFHSPLMEPVLAPFGAAAAEVSYTPPRLPLISGVTGAPAGPEVASPDYWVRHVREPVRFAGALASLRREGAGCFVELGPRPSLLAIARRQGDEGGLWLPSLRPGRPADQTLLTALGELYAAGFPVDWEGVHRGRPRRRCELPTYPFQRQRFWIEGWRAATTLSPVEAAASPALGRRLSLPRSQEVRYELEVAPGSPPFLGQHRLFDQVVVAAGFHLSLVLAAAEEAFGGRAATATDVVSPRALVLEEGSRRRLQLLLSPRGPGELTFQVLSLLPGEDPSSDAAWPTHLSGGLTLGAAAGAPPVDRTALEACCREELTAEGFYRDFWDAALTRGPAFRWITGIRRGRGEALARLERPAGDDPEELAPYPLAPGLIDSCFQLLTCCHPADGRLRIPFRVEAFRVHRRASGEDRLWCHARAHRPGGDETGRGPAGSEHRGDLRLFDDDGRLVAEITGFAVREVEESALRQDLTGAPAQDWLYEVAWRQRKLAAEPTAFDATGRWLLLTDGGGVGEALAAALESAGGRVARVSGGGSTEMDKVRCLLEEGPAEPGGAPWRGVVHLWSLDLERGEEGEEAGEGEVHAAQHRLCASALALVQELVGRQPPPRLWLVTRGGQAVEAAGGVNGAGARGNGAGAGLQPFAALLWGLGRVVTRELPELGCTLVDLDPLSGGPDLGGPDAHDQAARLLAELVVSDSEDQVAYRRGRRHVARLVRARRLRGQPAPIAREEATYLITGGLGTLGLGCARWLVEQGARHLVLTGRREASGEARRKISELEEQGAAVHVFPADVSDRSQVARLLARVREELPPLAGVVHAAGSLDDGLLPEQSWERFRRVLAPKVAGAWNLHLLTRELPLDWFVCFSSASSLLGNAGQGNYAAANAFLDRLAHHRRARGLPGLSVSWGPWEGSGMFADLSERERERLAARGMGTISGARGWPLLAELLAGETAHAAVLPVDWPRFLRLAGPAGPPPLLADLAPPAAAGEDLQASFRRRLESAPPEERPPLLEEHVQAAVAKVLGLSSPGEVAAEVGLFDLGLDSLMAIELKNALEGSLGCPLSSTLVFRHPTVEEITGHLRGEVLPEIFPQAEGAGAEAGQESWDRRARELADLTQEQVAELLRQRLGAHSPGEKG